MKWSLFATTIAAGALRATLADDDEPLPTLEELAATESDLIVLSTALNMSGVELSPTGPQTVFAPVAAAFQAIDPSTLQKLMEPNYVAHLADIISFHVFPGASVFSSDLADGQQVTMANGESITVGIDGDVVTVNGATVTEADIEGSNGVAHKIDQVLLPSFMSTTMASLLEAIVEDPESQFSTVAGLVVDAEVLEMDAGDITVFAPTNDAFEQLDEETLAGVQADRGMLLNVLMNHVALGVTPAQLLEDGGTVATIGGTILTVAIEDDVVTLSFPGGSTTVIAANILASDGIIHGIDTVILPALETPVDDVTETPVDGATETPGGDEETPVPSDIASDGPTGTPVEGPTPDQPTTPGQTPAPTQPTPDQPTTPGPTPAPTQESSAISSSLSFLAAIGSLVLASMI
jgi:uncharacterized surface protein with fasciclin (FAS1) repeats